MGNCARRVPGWSRALREAAVVAAIAVLMYAAVLSPTFGFLDDYAFLDLGQTGDQLLWKIQVGAGRPLNALLLNFGFTHVNGVAGLWVLRAFGIAGLGATAAVLHLIIRRSGGTRHASALTSLLVLTAASCQVFASWAQYFAAPWAMAIAAAAVLVLPRRVAPTRQTVCHICAAALLLSISMLVYQPAAMFFVTGVTAAVLWNPSGNRELGKRALASAIPFVVSIVVGYLATTAGRRIYDIGGNRTQLVDDLGGKAHWFISEVLVRSFDPLRVIVPLDTSMALAVGSLVLLGLARLFWGGWREALGRWSFVLGATVAAAIPVLAIAENWASARSLVGPMTMALLLIALATRGLARLVAASHKSERAIGTVLLAGVALLGIGRASYNTVAYFVVPQSTEWTTNQSEIQRVLATQPASVQIIGRDWYTTLAPGVGYDEFGLPSTSASYVLGPLERIVARQGGIRAPTVVANPRSGMPIEPIPTIDFRIRGDVTPQHPHGP